VQQRSQKKQKIGDISELKQRLVETLHGLYCSIDEAIDEWRNRLQACVLYQKHLI